MVEELLNRHLVLCFDKFVDFVVFFGKVLILVGGGFEGSEALLGLNEGVGVVLEFLFELVVLILPEGHLVFEFFVLDGEFLCFIFGLAMELFGGFDFGVFFLLVGVDFAVVDFEFVGFIGEAFDFECFAFDFGLEFEFFVGGLF